MPRNKQIMCRDFDWKVGTSGYAFWNSSVLGYDAGEIYTQHGIVSAYAQGDDKHVHSTRLDFVHGGRCYTRSWMKRYSRRRIKTLAKRFAAEIAGESQCHS